jgi:hypothetical protein
MRTALKTAEAAKQEISRFSRKERTYRWHRAFDERNPQWCCRHARSMLLFVNPTEAPDPKRWQQGAV